MKKILIFITVLLLLSCCAHEEKDVFSIYANFVNRKPNDRNGEDYIKLWVMIRYYLITLTTLTI